MKSVPAKLTAFCAMLLAAVALNAPTAAAEEEGWWWSRCAYNDIGGACYAHNGSGYFPDCQAGHGTGSKSFFWAMSHCGNFIEEN